MTTAAATNTSPPTPQQQFISRLQRSLADGSFVKLGLGRPQAADDPTLHKLLVRRVVIQGREQLSLVWRHQTKDITKNLAPDAALALLASLIGKPFNHAHLQTSGHDLQLALGKKGQWALRVGKLAGAAAAPAMAAEAADTAGDPEAGLVNDTSDDTSKDTSDDTSGPSLAHARHRPHPLALSLPFLAELGITDAQQRLVPAMARKWRQINKFAEVLGHAIGQSSLAQRDAAQAVRVLDFGAGKGYLTFAVHQLLQDSGRQPDVVGVEQRADLTGLCNAAVARLGLQGLRFHTGDVRHQPQALAGACDIMIALHACDTATDVALHRGIAAQAALIVCAPCCHQELRPQLRSPAVLAPLLRHGIHMATQAEMLTDAMRALLLELAGYDTRVFEFISPEHTSKNRMLLAVRRSQPLPPRQQQALRDELVALKAFFGVQQQTLDSLLAAPAG